MLLGGTVVLMWMDLPMALRALAVLAWWYDAGRSIVRVASGQQRVLRVRLAADGRCWLIGRQTPARAVCWAPGSVVTQGWAWLRLKDSDGGVYCELFLSGQVERKAWRGLQVIWRWGARRQRT